MDVSSPVMSPQFVEAFEQVVGKLSAAATDAFNKGDVGACAESYADDAIMFLPDRPPLEGRDAIEATLRDYATSGLKLAPVDFVEIRSSGEMGYCAGTYEFTVPPENGVPEKSRGKFVTVFMRQSDGSWKAVIDSLMFDQAHKA